MNPCWVKSRKDLWKDRPRNNKDWTQSKTKWSLEAESARGLAPVRTVEEGGWHRVLC